jgi:hypothetical protein
MWRQWRNEALLAAADIVLYYKARHALINEAIAYKCN